MSEQAGERVRAEIHAQSRDAYEAMKRAKSVFAAPYSSADAAREFHWARGYWHGLCKAVETIDALNRTVEDQ